MLPDVLSVNLESAHANLLAGSVIANLLAFLGKIQIAAGGFLLSDYIGRQFFVIDLVDRNASRRDIANSVDRCGPWDCHI